MLGDWTCPDCGSPMDELPAAAKAKPPTEAEVRHAEATLLYARAAVLEELAALKEKLDALRGQ